MTINLEMLTTEDVCSGTGTDNSCHRFVIVTFEHVGTHASCDSLDTLLCLLDEGAKISRRGKNEKLCVT